MQLVPHPEYVKLTLEIEELRGQLTGLLSLHDELLFHSCKNIEAEYMIKVGSLEYKIFEQECQILRLKRKMELIQMAINRGETYDINFIERLLDKEYAEYQQRLNEQATQLKAALDRIEARVLSTEENAELKTLYRGLVKKLHPDLNPGQSDKERTLFLKVIHAYENGDLDMLRTLDTLSGDIETILPDTGASGLEMLTKHRIVLEDKMQEVSKRIELIRSSFPYNQKEFLADEEQIKQRQTMLRQRLKDLKIIFSQLKERLEEMEGN